MNIKHDPVWKEIMIYTMLPFVMVPLFIVFLSVGVSVCGQDGGTISPPAWWMMTPAAAATRWSNTISGMLVWWTFENINVKGRPVDMVSGAILTPLPLFAGGPPLVTNGSTNTFGDTNSWYGDLDGNDDFFKAPQVGVGLSNLAFFMCIKYRENTTLPNRQQGLGSSWWWGNRTQCFWRLMTTGSPPHLLTWWVTPSIVTGKLTSAGHVPTNTWTSIGVCYNSTQVELYIGGVLDTATTYEGSLITNPVWNSSEYTAIAMDDGYLQQFKYFGSIDEPQIYKYLSAANFATLHTNYYAPNNVVKKW